MLQLRADLFGFEIVTMRHDHAATMENSRAVPQPRVKRLPYVVCLDPLCRQLRNSELYEIQAWKKNVEKHPFHLVPSILQNIANVSNLHKCILMHINAHSQSCSDLEISWHSSKM